MGSNPIPFSAEIENIRAKMPAGAAEDFRTFAEGLVGWISSVQPNPPRPGGTAANSQATPSGIGFSVAGSNGTFTASLDNGNQNGRTVWHEISYSPNKSFTTSVTIMPLTSATSVALNLPGQNLFFRRRSSFDQVNWSSYQLASTNAIGSGLVSSAATSAGAAFNQTNFGVVSSAAQGATADVQISGANGPLTSLPAVKGSTTTVLPAAIISNVPLGSSHFVAWNGSNYVLRPTLASVLSDDLTPIGKVSVVESGAPTLPTVTLVVQGGYIVGATWTGDNGLTAVPTFVVHDSTGSGAIIQGTGVTAGHLDGIQVINAGDGLYSAHPTVTVSGGTFGGETGGGTALGGNGGRLTAV